jgi:hypothetical protein
MQLSRPRLAPGFFFPEAFGVIMPGYEQSPDLSGKALHGLAGVRAAVEERRRSYTVQFTAGGAVRA